MTTSSESRRLWLRALAFTVLAPGTVAVLVPLLLLGRPSWLTANMYRWTFAGVLPIVLGFTLYFRSVAAFLYRGKGTPAPLAAPTALVTTGPYRYSRNPMYIGVLAIIAGQALVYQSVTLVWYLLVVTVVFNVFIFGYERHALVKRFGQSYCEYCESVPVWLPNIHGMKSLYRDTILPVGAFVLAAGTVAHLVRLAVGLPVSEMPDSIHAILVALSGYAGIGCLAFARAIELAGALRKVVFALVTVLLLITFVMHAYSIAAQDNSWLGIFPRWYSALAVIMYGGFALFLKSRRWAGA